MSSLREFCTHRRVMVCASAILLSPLLLLALQIGRPFHIDDALYVQWARSIAVHWADPYAGWTNWHGVSEPMVSAMRNPPLLGWTLALFGSAAGWSERCLHSAQLIPAALFLAAAFGLARRWSSRPLIALAICACSPAFLLMGATIMADMLMSAAWTCAVYFWCRVPTRWSSAFGAAAVLVAGFTKWYGLALIPLLLAWELMSVMRITRRCAWLALPLLLTLAHDGWVSSVHGISMFGHAATTAATGESLHVHPALHVWLGLAFLGGSCAGILLLLPMLLRTHVWTLGALAATAVIAACFAASQLSAWPALAAASATEQWIIAAELGVLGFAGASVLALTFKGAWSGGPEARVLGLWIAGTFLFGAFLNWAILVRSFLPALPALAIVTANAIDAAPFSTRPLGRMALVIGLVCGGWLGFEVLRADNEVANEARESAQSLAMNRATDRLWFQGHWGFQHYVEAAGGKAMDREHEFVRSGDTILVPMLNTNVFGVAEDSVRIVDRRIIPLQSRFVVMGPRSGAGFWAHTLGPLPFGWNLGDVAETWVLERR
ncbi:MAG: glycosyltransferase family 39 protein [Planctomycetes bacterium]|nr:glycosyltransferase family 39 protein [Planctomycetota bacterium]